MNAIITNTITSTLLSCTLFVYFACAFISWLRRDPRFTGLLVILFFSMFAFSVIAIVMHYKCWQMTACHLRLWLAIALGVVFINYCIAYAMNMPDATRIFIIFASLMMAWLQVALDRYIFTALSLLMISLFAIIYSKKLTRIGFIGLIFSNIFWILLHYTISLILGYDVPAKWDYDNDVYHILEIIFTFIIFWSVIKGQWPYPSRQNQRLKN